MILNIRSLIFHLFSSYPAKFYKRELIPPFWQDMLNVCRTPILERDIVSRNINHFTTDNPDKHIFLLDDFLGTGRISSALSKPVMLLQPGDTKRINRVKTTVNASVVKCKRQLEYIANSIW